MATTKHAVTNKALACILNANLARTRGYVSNPSRHDILVRLDNSTSDCGILIPSRTTFVLEGVTSAVYCISLAGDLAEDICIFATEI